MQSGLEFLDTFFGMGSMMFSLVPGHDCPAYATYIDMTFTKGEQTKTNKNAICIFEYTSDAPLQRHTAGTSVSISRNTYLVVRSVSTVGNYDYTIDYIFYLDGTIEVKVRASGFIFAAFMPQTPGASPVSEPDNTYGYRIHDAAMSSMHDHVLNFRADMDIAGGRNSFQRTAITPHVQAYAWDKPEVPGYRNTMHLNHTIVSHETGINWPHNSGEIYLITSNQTNAWGSQKAYRILPGTGIGTPSHLTIINSTTLGRSAMWASSDIWVLRAHDTEPSSAHHMNYIDPTDPLVDFSKMVDGERIVDEDLVVYFNLGGHHVPHSGDVPNTLMHTSASSVMFSPFNHFDYDVSRDTRQGVRIDRALSSDAQAGSDGELKSREKRGEDRGNGGVRYFGAKYDEDVAVHKEELEPDLSRYMRDREDDSWDMDGGLLGLFGGWKKNGWFGR